ncbi:MAG TPA: prepilin peptidase [Bryobacteraceae bacterium]|nr:prepilin peptidase [Bryobacteraceae bacterium]
MLVESVLQLVLALVFGLLIGSFLNVCIYRFPRDLSVVAPRSFCPECGKPVAWRDNIPLVSYILLLGRCRDCRKPIGWRYPLVEFTTAALFVCIVARYGWSLAALRWAVFETLLVALFWTDLEERILPDELTIGGSVAGVILAFFTAVPGVMGELLLPLQRTFWRSLANAAIGAIFLALPIWLLGFTYSRLRKREGLGFGDVKLLLLIGVFLGLENGLLALLIGAVSGSVLGIVYIYFAGKKAAEYELPFGSFLCVGAALVPLFVK